MLFSGGIFDFEALETRFAELDSMRADPDLWNNQDKAKEVTREHASLEAKILGHRALQEALSDMGVYVELAGEGDKDAGGELLALLDKAEAMADDAELRRMLSGEYDDSNAIVTIHPGAGGTESQDFGDMLFRMYLRWAERRGFKVDVIEYTPGDGAGLKSAIFTIEGEYAYGYTRSEAGIHRLVRISPFDSAKRRHTSFCAVHVAPEIDDTIVVDIDTDDLRIDTYRSSGAGGQHVNKTDSAVRLTHLPTGMVVACQNERSQHKNKATAMKILRSKLYELERLKQREKLDSIGPSKMDNAFGSQIRNYVLHPYRLVKDTRTGQEVGNADAVLDGDIDPFIRAFLMSESA